MDWNSSSAPLSLTESSSGTTLTVLSEEHVKTFINNINPNRFKSTPFVVPWMGHSWSLLFSRSSARCVRWICVATWMMSPPLLAQVSRTNRFLQQEGKNDTKLMLNLLNANGINTLGRRGGGATGQLSPVNGHFTLDVSQNQWLQLWIPTVKRTDTSISHWLIMFMLTKILIFTFIYTVCHRMKTTRITYWSLVRSSEWFW